MNKIVYLQKQYQEKVIEIVHRVVTNTSRMASLDEFDTFWETEEEQVNPQQIEASWNKHEKDIFDVPKKSRFPKIVYISSAVAAAIAVIVMLFVQPQFGSSSSAAAMQWVEISAPSSSVKDLYLPDSTHIVLSPGSTLQYSKNFTDNRQVILTGNAYCNVTKDAHHPFQIQAGSWTSTVLGTSFFIENKGEDAFTLNLFEGKVQVTHQEGTKNYILQSGQKLAVDNQQTEPQIEVLFPTTAKNQGYIDFDKMPLNYVFGFIESQYQIPLQYTGTNNPTITFRWSTTDDLNAQLQALANLTGLHIRNTGKYIIVSP